MIQATGTITLSDGVTKFKDPLININFGSSQKHLPTYIFIEIGEEITHEEKYTVQEKIMIPNPEYDVDSNNEINGIYPEIESFRPKLETRPIKSFKVNHTLQRISYNEPEPGFVAIQDFAKAILEQTYQDVNFQII